jgi:hypothetical protein
MVHKKTEYRLQFHLLANDLRKQIWQENTNARYILDTSMFYILSYIIENKSQKEVVSSFSNRQLIFRMY